jgi:hypothetical protein
MAERVGFEPTDHLAMVNALAGRPVRPLRHLSSEGSQCSGGREAPPRADGDVASLAGGTVAERTNAPALKAGGPQGPGVRIPPVPLSVFMDVHQRSGTYRL